MRMVFAGTGAIAVPLLEALASKGLVSLVLTAPDAPGKRGKRLLPSPVKEKAEELGLDVYQPVSIRTEAREHIASYGADTLLSFCYGKIFGPRFLSLFRETFNVHPSLLPLHRGPSPIYAAIRNGDRETGISLQSIGAGVDEGDIYAVLRIPLDGTETEGSLSGKVASLAPGFVLPVLLDPGRAAVKQEGRPSSTSFVAKEDGHIDFSASAAEVHATIRACSPWPKAYGLLGGVPLYITGVWGSGFAVGGGRPSEKPGTIVALEKGKGLKIAAGDGYIYAVKVLPPMRKEMDAPSFINGSRGAIGSILE